jgi:L-seryl-tRNA(Ser) seleniumtransferase
MNAVSKNNKKDRLRSIPSVDKILERADIKELLNQHSRGIVLKGIQSYLQKVREQIVISQKSGPDSEKVKVEITASEVEKEINSFSLTLLEKVINATGVILHTNLGRSILPEEAIMNMQEIAHSYSNLEYNIKEGNRGSRYSHVEELLCEISGGESAFVVNNNAGALLLALNSLSNGKEAIVSRGELIEIGGSFRIPDVMKRSGAVMIEVGTTNKTHLIDYEGAINDRTGILLKVHTSNYHVVGFTSEVDLQSLITLGRERTLPVVNDLGSGCLIDFSPYGLVHEPTVQEVIKTGIDVVTFSGDKLLGGPQAGIIIGKKRMLDKLMKNPLNRALRIDKLTLAALESTLRLYLDNETVIQKVPTLRMLTLPLKKIEGRACKMKDRLDKKLPDHVDIQIVNDTSQVGGGALPSQELPTKVVALRSNRVTVQEVEEKLRKNKPSIITRINNDQIRIDLRTVAEKEEEDIERALTNILSMYQ